jgi:hypothetical protein
MNNTGKAAAVTASLSSLPDDQRQQVLSYLTCPELLTLTMVSKAVRVIALRSHSLVFDNSGTTNNNNDRTTTRHTNPNLRRAIGNKINLEPFSTHPRHQQQNQRQRWIDGSNGMNEAATISETHLDNLLQRFHSLRKLRLNGITPPVHDEQRLIQIINSCQAASSIVHIELHNVRLVQNKYKLILPNNQNLQHFAISGTIFSFYNPVLKSFVSSSKNLQCLHLNGCRSLVDADVQDMSRTILHSPKSKLKELSLKSSSKLIRPGIHCPSLEILDLSLSPMIQDLTNVICPRLKKIDLSYCTKVTDDSVHSLLLSCPCLEVLNLDGCSTLSAADFTSRSLKRLDMNLCTDLNSVNINCEELKKLEVCIDSLSYDKHCFISII